MKQLKKRDLRIWECVVQNEGIRIDQRGLASEDRLRILQVRPFDYIRDCRKMPPWSRDRRFGVQKSHSTALAYHDEAYTNRVFLFRVLIE